MTLGRVSHATSKNIAGEAPFTGSSIQIWAALLSKGCTGQVTMRFEERHEGITALTYQALLPTVYGCTTKLATLRKDKEGCTRT